MLLAYVRLLTSIVAISFIFHDVDCASHPFRGSPDRMYDRHINVFNPDGELLQSKYAAEAANKGDTVVCLIHRRVPEINLEDKMGVESDNRQEILIGIASEPRDVFLDRRGVDMVNKVDENIWALCTGLAGDGRAIVRLIRKVCMNYHSKFGAAPTLEYLATIVSEMQHDFTLSGSERPYGVTVLLVGYDEGSIEPCVFQSSVDGTVTQWLATSAGRGADECLELLCDRIVVENTAMDTQSKYEAENLVLEALNLPQVWQADKGGVEAGAKGRPIDLYRIGRTSVDEPATIVCSRCQSGEFCK